MEREVRRIDDFLAGSRQLNDQQPHGGCCARRSPRRQPLQLFAPVLDDDQAGTGPLRTVRRIVLDHDEPAVSGNIVRSGRCRTRINKVLRLKEDARFAELQSRPGRVTRDAGESSLTIEKEQLGSIC